MDMELRTGDGVTDRRRSSGRNMESRMKTAAKWLAVQESWGMDRSMRVDSAAPVFSMAK